MLFKPKHAAIAALIVMGLVLVGSFITVGYLQLQAFTELTEYMQNEMANL